MSDLDYYGRLMRRATARAEASVAVALDPFDSTAPWPLIGETKVSGEKPPIEHRLAPTSPTPRAFAVPSASPAVSVPASIDGSDDARRPTAMTPSPPDATPLPPREDSSVEPPPGPSTLRITTLRPAEHAPVPVVPRHEQHQAQREDPEAQPLALEPAPLLEFAERQFDIAAPHDSPPPGAPSATAPDAARAAMLQPPAPPLRIPISAPPELGVPAPVISIGEIDIDIDQRAAAAAVAAPPAPPARERAGGLGRGGRVDPDLLRGPNDRAFGIGQV